MKQLLLSNRLLHQLDVMNSSNDTTRNKARKGCISKNVTTTVSLLEMSLMTSDTTTELLSIYGTIEDYKFVQTQLLQSFTAIKRFD